MHQKDLTFGEDGTVLVQQQHDIRDLSPDRRHVVRVEVVLNRLVDGQVVVNHNANNHHEYNVERHNGLLENLEDDDAGGSGGVDSGTDQNQTDKDTNQGIGNGGKAVRQKPNFEHPHVLGNGVNGSFRFLPLNEDPTNGNGGVDHANDGDGLEDTGSQRSSSKTTPSLLHESHTLLVDSLFIGHLNELLVSHGVCLFNVLPTR